MTSSGIAPRQHWKLASHGYTGLAIILAAELLLASGNELVGRWFIPIVWTGYIFFIDALVYKVKSHSLLVNNRSEFLILAVVSIGGWWLFEFYNAPRFWQSDLELWWHYHNLEPNLFLRRFGYDWSFATIFPAMFETAELLEATWFDKLAVRRPIALSKTAIYSMIAAGAMGALVPLIIISRWLVPLVWLSLAFLLDPINSLRGRPAIIADISRGDYRRLVSLMTAGGLCGLLWEFWNKWAISRWTYTVPYLGNVKLFEMPLLGYFAFLPFAVECWTVYIFCRSFLGQVDGELRLTGIVHKSL